MTTERQKKAVAFVKRMLDIKFTGNINDEKAVHLFLSKYLRKAKDVAIYYDHIEDQFSIY